MPRRVTDSDKMPDFTGRLLDSRLILLDQLGAGAYGKVYRALDVSSPTRAPVYFAVKCLLTPEPGSSQEEHQRREFTHHPLVSDHPNIVTFHGLIQEDPFIFVVLDFCDGGDLFAAITETRIFLGNDGLIKETFTQLIDAVDHCHQNDVFHRDLKPENVLLTKDIKLLLADFGLSGQGQISQSFGCGSAYYMSPECIGKEICVGKYSTRHSDIWSLGVILINMITSRNPWRYATTQDECFVAFLHDEEWLRKALPISNGANAILKRIFSLNPARRIGLSDLRKEILRLDTFFMSEQELASAPPSVRQALKGAQGAPSQEAPGASIDDTLFGDSSSSSSSEVSSSSLSSDEVYVFRSPPDDLALLHGTAIIVDVRNPSVSSTFFSGSRSGAGSLSSGADSDGPITPATRPINPAIEVPDLPEGETLDQSAVVPEDVPVLPKLPAAAKIRNLFGLAPTRFA